MSLFQFLQLQPVEPDDEASELDHFEPDKIALEEYPDAESLSTYWSGVVDDIAEDPDWSSFYSDHE